jgi:hypothetical protein
MPRGVKQTTSLQCGTVWTAQQIAPACLIAQGVSGTLTAEDSSNHSDRVRPKQLVLVVQHYSLH